MKITALQEYGMRCLLQLAEHGSGEPLRIRKIAEQEGLSTDYVEKILTHLRKNGLVKSVRGLNGGYVLAQPPERVSVGEALSALSEKPVQISHLRRDLCKQFPGNEKQCVHMRACNIRQVWSLIMVQIFGQLGRISLADLLGSEEEVEERLLRFVERANLPVKGEGEAESRRVEMAHA